MTTSATGTNPQTLIFDPISYDLSKLEGGDTTKHGASKTFTYYVREKNDSSISSHYKFDQSVYKFTVVATDNTEGTINCKVTYRKGTVNPKGEWTADASTAEETFADDTTPHLHQHLLHLFAPFWYVGRHSDVPCRRGGALRCCGLDAHSSQGECEGR